MVKWWVVVLGAALCACAGETGPECDAGQGDDAVVDGHRLILRARFEADAGEVSFMTPAASVFSMPVSDIAGKPYYVGTFAGGVDQGVDYALHHAWGRVPEDLVIEYQTPPMLEDGPYDVALIVYTQNPVSSDTMDEPFAQVPLAGELSAFTISQDEVRQGDPGFPNGVVRVNVEGGDAELELVNRLVDPDQNIGVLKALTNTILTVP